MAETVLGLTTTTTYSCSDPCSCDSALRILSQRELILIVAVGGIPISTISNIPSSMLLSYPLLFTEVTCTIMVATKSWEGMAAGEGVAVMAVGVTSTGVRDEDTHGCFLVRYGGFF